MTKIVNKRQGDTTRPEEQDDIIAEALELALGSVPGGCNRDIVRAAIAAHEARKVQAEPVAWQYSRPGGEWRSAAGKLSDEYVAEKGYEVRPLYAAPVAAPAPATEDSEMLDWLEANWTRSTPTLMTCGVTYPAVVALHFNHYPEESLKRALTLRDALRAAMQATKEDGHE